MSYILDHSSNPVSLKIKTATSFYKLKFDSNRHTQFLSHAVHIEGCNHPPGVSHRFHWFQTVASPVQ